MVHSNFITIVDKNEISQAQTLFTQIMKNHATEINSFTLYFPNRISAEFQIFWYKELSFWYAYKIIEEEKIKKHRNVFGKEKLNKITNKNYDLQCNIPISGYRKQLAATFVKNDENKIFVAHSGRIGGVGDFGIQSKENENKFKQSTSFSKIKDNNGRDLFLISEIDETLIQNFAKFINEVHSIKYSSDTFNEKSMSKNSILDDLENKGVSKLHVQILRKFLVYEGLTITDSTKRRGIKGVSKIPSDSIVSEPHYMHNLVRGVYKPESDEFALSIQMNPASIWGSEIDSEAGNWKINYDFGNETKYSGDISSLTKCYELDIPIGVILKPEKGKNKILGLGIISSIDGAKFTIIPHTIKNKTSEVQKLSSTYVNDEIDQGDYSAQGSESTVYVRAKQGRFKELLLQEYKGKCAFCEFDEPEYLIGAHIVPYNVMRKEDPQNAMNPSDGILLCKLCDIAFERGDISLQENLQIIVSEKLKNSKNNTVKSWLSEIHNIIPINSESKFKPHLKFIQRKLELVQET